MPQKRTMLAAFFLLAAFALLSAAEPVATVQPPYRVFPNLYRSQGALALPLAPQSAQALPQALPQAAAQDVQSRIPLLTNNIVLSFYGKPDSPRMGILGEYSKEDLGTLMDAYAKMFASAAGQKGIIKAYYIIYGTCWPGGEIGYLDEAVLKSYIDYAASKNMLVFIDHQIGKYSVPEAMAKILPFLKYPNVHLAIDPEWRTLKPMREIGSITGEELNQAQEIMDNYIRENNIPGIRILVVHQFQKQMIRNREVVRANFDRVLLVHTADGFGSPAVKKLSYALNAQAVNMPVKGFKLFLKSSFPLAGFDEPLLKPEEVLALDPSPSLIIYQ